MAGKFCFGSYGSKPPPLHVTLYYRTVDLGREPRDSWFKPLAPKPYGEGLSNGLHKVVKKQLKNVFNYASIFSFTKQISETLNGIFNFKSTGKINFDKQEGWC